MSDTAMPTVVSTAEWDAARAELLAVEKEATRTLDRIAAQRRRLPMVRFGEYTFTTAEGTVTLRELFGEHRQLAVYQFMNAGPDAFCGGCTYFTQNVVNLDGLAGKDIAWATVSDMPIDQMAGYWKRMGWDHIPFASSSGTTFSADCGAGGGFQLSLFLRDGDNVFRTYATGQRGVDRFAVQHGRVGPRRLRPPGGLGRLSHRLAAVPDLRMRQAADTGGDKAVRPRRGP